ncbi:Aerobic respiration control sensor protein ArcB [Zhongshania aliphaticivorans]|uniref:histidine kinase n=1 Tax=Zhongshania aliphaticivorans TaxID=1470434 RepID=A0A5S9QJ23_9GAMM|nr:cache domain-containing protein [Zhongshania aliphaticivorans]CAA0109979.1 Aerobic respiration control sensor protein ArcB [Zhongshania aliphaticivorans]CAA0117965.1 Aerobic respiration control sensor protein ArcB [Zhongshania aliphaticivorans]CAA0121778.1 Aerobic respiration control sensor protein ArcB [Zhongshania aliphaticivorans]
MRTKRSLVQIYLLSLVALSAIPLAIFGYIWIAKEYERYTQQSEAWRDSYVESRRELLRREVAKAVEYLDFKHTQLNRQLYNDLRQQVAVGISLIEDTRKEFVGESNAERLTRLRATMGSLRFLNNKGFFFLFDENGRALLPPMNPTADKRMTDDATVNAFSSQIASALQDKKYDFVEYRFTDPDSRIATERNFSFVYYYKPLNIYIGASIYLSDELNRLKREVIERIAAVPIDPDNSILFVVDKDGRQLVNAYDPSNVGLLMPDIVGVSARVGGEDHSLFTELSWLDRDGQKKPVISYIRRFEPWGWVIGSGVFLDELNVKLGDERAALQERVKEHVRFIVVIAFVLMIFSTIAARWLARRSAGGFHIFQQFFADASKRSTAINIERLPFAEFQRLAEDANFMVEKRTETERALKLSERRFQLALDAAQNHLWDLDLQTGLVTVGESFFRMLGYHAPAKPYPVGAFKEIAHGDDMQIIASAVDSWLGLATGNSVEFRVKDRAGNFRWIYSRGDVVENDQNDKPIRAMGIMTDVTERKRIEQELVNARIAAEDALHAKSQFLSSVSHELRTPLNGVLGYAQLLQRDKGIPTGSQEYLRAIESCGKHLLTLINDVLDLAKIESGNIDIVSRPNKLDDIVSNVSDIVAHRAKSKGLEFLVERASDLPDEVQIDEVKLRQVLVNLLDNAVKFTSVGSVVLKLHANLETKQLMFSVTDSGMGIPQEKLRDVFEPFRQVNPQDGKGTGLGLSICRRLVEAMGGSLNVSSEFGQGACFYFDVPLLDVEVDSIAGELMEEVQEPAVAELVSGVGQNPAIIVADDVAVNRHLLLSMLEDVTTDVREAVNGLEVIAHLKQRPAQLVLMDLRMPGMDGMEATRVIKQEMGMSDVAIIMASATTDEDMMEEAVQVGCDGFLPKPISIGDLLKVVAETCDLPSQQGENTHQAVVSKAAPLSNFILPKEQDLQDLSAAVDVGDVTSLRELLQQIRSRAPECEGFVDEAEEYLREFDFEKLARLLVQATNEAALNDV